MIVKPGVSKLVAAMLASVVVVPGPAAAKPAERDAVAADAADVRHDLSGTWQFAIAPDAASAAALADFHRPGFDASRFDAVPVPSNWPVLGYEAPHYKPYKPGDTAAEGFYLKRFTLPAGWDARRVLLHFDGIWSSAEVWLNGQPMGRHDSGFTPYVVDASALLRPGENVLAVRVRQIQRDALLDSNDDWTLPGIYRDVWLEAMPAGRWLDAVQTSTSFDSDFRDADLAIRVMVGDRNDRVAGTSFKLIPDGFDGILDSYRQPTRDYWETKAVYAPVFPAVEKLRVTAGQASVHIPIRNAYDFTDLDAVTIAWALMEDGRRLATGETRIDGQPHSLADLEVPLAALTATRAGKAYYVQLGFKDAGGAEIGRRAVELLPRETAPPRRADAAVTVTQGDRTVIAVGKSAYSFDPARGALVAGTVAGKPVLGALQPTLWRPLNTTELMFARPPHPAGWPDLDRYDAKATRWRVTEVPEGVRIESTVDYRIDARNSFQADYDYLVGGDGVLRVHYVIRPKVEAPWLPHVGVRVALPSPIRQLRWLGRGPFDSWPNQRAAGMLGLWSENIAPGGDTGLKEARWAEPLDAGGKGPRIGDAGHVSIDRSAADRVAILSDVRARPTKWAPEGPDHLLTTDGQPFAGGFSIRLDPGDED